MQCKNHPNHQAEFICSSCLDPLCRARAGEGEQGKHFCLLVICVILSPESMRPQKRVWTGLVKRKQGNFRAMTLTKNKLIDSVYNQIDLPKVGSAEG